MAHLFVDISSHGFGHLAQTAPVLNRLAELRPDLRLTLRTALPPEKLAQRMAAPFELIAAASDFGYRMIDALTIDGPATAAAYRAAHADFAADVEREARLLERVGADAVFANVSYRPLAGAARAGIPAIAMCSLNWADLFEHFFGAKAWAPPVHAEMLTAYRSAAFLRTTPGMPMHELDGVIGIGPIASIGRGRRVELCRTLGISPASRLVLVALGGIPTRLPVEDWPARVNTHWLVPAAWQVARSDMSAFEPLGWPFADLLASSDAVVTKPGYGTFAEAACNGTAVLYQRREDWPEQDCLIEWLSKNARAREITGNELRSGALGAVLDEVLSAAVPPAPATDGIEQAARHLATLLQ
ncbi:hypothetical protein [Sulfurisoma sediminicola]|uniref:UDP:flavonoid glycosyltransferase YjiC (YdhE family) n=1 Tax=Sulfurisoma sediminicola TaxID=1381557 RepID=A0A497X9Q5_9PROT|nr:hypothetical protein [Sulfurisoma sediminicola]RLJ62808.1 hypothetical protein DFR35_2625 [Sulfurisoma sediminicola]